MRTVGFSAAARHTSGATATGEQAAIESRGVSRISNAATTKRAAAPLKRNCNGTMVTTVLDTFMATAGTVPPILANPLQHRIDQQGPLLLLITLTTAHLFPRTGPHNQMDAQYRRTR